MAAKTRTKTKISIPKPFKVPFQEFKGLARGASKEIAAVGPYTGPYAAPIDPRETEALTMLTDLGRSRTGVADPVLALARRMMDPSFTDVGNDSVIKNAIAAGAAPIEDARNRQLQQIRSVASGSGVDLGTRAFLEERESNREVDRVIGEMSSKFLAENLARREALAAAAPQIYGLGLGLEESPARLIGEAGSLARGLQQDTVVNPALAAFQEKINSPMRAMLPYQTFFSTTGLPFNQTTTTGQVGGGGLGGALQGAAGGASMGSMFGPWGAAAGGVAGGLMGAFGK